MEEIYEMAFPLILHAGNAKAKAMMAIEAARESHFPQAQEFLGEAQQDLHLAHQMQTVLIQNEAKGERNEINILMVHAQDHLTGAMLTMEHAQEFLHIYQILHEITQNKEGKSCHFE